MNKKLKSFSADITTELLLVVGENSNNNKEPGINKVGAQWFDYAHHENLEPLLNKFPQPQPQP